MFHAKKVYSMLDNENLRESALRCHQFLREAGVAHSVAGRHGSLPVWLSAQYDGS